VKRASRHRCAALAIAALAACGEARPSAMPAPAHQAAADWLEPVVEETSSAFDAAVARSEWVQDEEFWGENARELPLDEWLAPAREARRSMHGLDGFPLFVARSAAIAAYARLELQPGLSPERRALAAFRRGELLRAGGFDAAAARAFETGRSALEPGPLWARACLELARLERRAARAPSALALLEQVRGEPRSGAGARARATLAQAELALEQGERASARRLLAQLVEHERAASVRIAAADELALALLAEGDLEGAAGALERCRSVLGEEAHELTQHGVRVRARLARMRARAALGAAIEARARERAATRVEHANDAPSE